MTRKLNLLVAEHGAQTNAVVSGKEITFGDLRARQQNAVRNTVANAKIARLQDEIAKSTIFLRATVAVMAQVVIIT